MSLKNLAIRIHLKLEYVEVWISLFFTPLVFEFHDKSARKKIPKADRVVRYAETRAERLKREFAILRAPCVCAYDFFVYMYSKTVEYANVHIFLKVQTQ